MHAHGLDPARDGKGRGLGALLGPVRIGTKEGLRPTRRVHGGQRIGQIDGLYPGTLQRAHEIIDARRKKRRTVNRPQVRSGDAALVGHQDDKQADALALEAITHRDHVRGTRLGARRPVRVRRQLIHQEKPVAFPLPHARAEVTRDQP